MGNCGCGDVDDSAQRGVLIALLVINGFMFLVEAIAGIMAESTGLLADSLDMLADATVYGISLCAVGRSGSIKVRAARWSGWFQICLSGGVLVEIARRYWIGSEPVPGWMISVGLVALVANVACLSLLHRHRKGEVHMRASWIFSRNDVIANLGVLLAGGLVALTASRLPDLTVGLIISVIVFRGGLRILKEAASEQV
jgi:cation diffusion facilitator family transporter